MNAAGADVDGEVADVDVAAANGAGTGVHLQRGAANAVDRHAAGTGVEIDVALRVGHGHAAGARVEHEATARVLRLYARRGNVDGDIAVDIGHRRVAHTQMQLDALALGNGDDEIGKAIEARARAADLDVVMTVEE